MDWKIKRSAVVPSSGVLDVDSVARHQIAASIAAQIEADMLSAFAGTAAAPDETVSGLFFDGPAFVEQCERLLRDARRSQFIVIVDAALSYDAPLLLEMTPCDGQRIEMSHRQAQELHARWPMRLHRVLSRDRAEFVPASGLLPEIVAHVLPSPPYEVPVDDAV